MSQPSGFRESGKRDGAPVSALSLLAPILETLPLAPLQQGASFILRSLSRRHADLFLRLQKLQDVRILIDPTDLPVLFIVAPGCAAPWIKVTRRSSGAVDAAATIRGRLTHLLALLQGTVDGDSLFFSRDLTIEGDTAAILHVRNALDGAEIDLAREIAAGFGIAAGLAYPAIRAHQRVFTAAGRTLLNLHAALLATRGNNCSRGAREP
ncbi:SCP2 domain-containing protein [Dongia sp.]|uniref:ubiquinone anaerobic biosynthesis accessory factor UbiT n=1 Tax=Dongia sp. TaxID=1977262 RepID=UPI0035B49611